MDEVDEQALIMREQREEAPVAFLNLFYHFYPEFLSFAGSLLADRPSAKNLTTEAFFMLWKKREYLDSGKNIRAFLYNTIRNSCFNYLKYRELNPDSVGYEPQIKMDVSFPPAIMEELLAYVASET